ncbi:MAG: STAS domain-containing protein [bacterium]
MNIDLENRKDHLIARLNGRIAGETSIRLYSQIKSLLPEDENKNLVLDFSGVDFIDSSGLGSLVAVNSHLLKKGKKLTLASVPENLMGLLKVTNLTSILDIVSSVKDVS